MSARAGWAAFLALVAVLFAAGPARGNSQLIVACFDPSNAEAIGRFGPADATVAYAFNIGGCLVISPGMQVAEAGRVGNLTRLTLMGGQPPLFAPAWAMSGGATGFAGFEGATRRLLSQGPSFVRCYDDAVSLQRRWDDYVRRRQAFEARGGRPLGPGAMVVRIFVSDEAAQLVRDDDELRSEGARLDRRCAGLFSLEMDEHFIRFVRSLRG